MWYSGSQAIAASTAVVTSQWCLQAFSLPARLVATLGLARKRIAPGAGELSVASWADQGFVDGRPVFLADDLNSRRPYESLFPLLQLDKHRIRPVSCTLIGVRSVGGMAAGGTYPWAWLASFLEFVPFGAEPV